MFSCLRPSLVSLRCGLIGIASHLSISCSNHNDSTIHIRSTSNHVLDIIGVTGAVDVRVVSVRGLVFDMRS